MTLPKGWKTQRLDAIASTQLGKMLNKNKQTGNNTVPYLRSFNVQWGHFDLSDVKEMDIDPLEREKFTVCKGDLLVCEGGESGRVALWNQDYEIGFQNALHRVRAGNSISNKYLYYYFEWLVKNNLINHLFNGVTIKHFPQESLRSVQISYPENLTEQEKIVEILEDHLSRLDAALADVKQAKIKAAQFRRSLLNACFTGLLFKGEKDAETGIPCHWMLTTLSEVAKWTSGGTPTSSNSSYYDGDVPWVVIGDLTEGVVMDTAKMITATGLEASSAKILPQGTVMLAMYGASIGRTGVMGKTMSTNQAIACGIVDESKIVREYLLYFLQSQKQNFIFAGKGGAQPNISQGVVKDWAIALPPLNEQKEIISEIERQLSYLDSSSRMTEHIQKESASLRRSLLQAAFTGQLTKEEVNV